MTSLKPGFKFVLFALIFSGLIEIIDARVIDKIIAVVDSGVVLASDVETRLKDLKTSAGPKAIRLRLTLIYANKFLNATYP